MAPHRRRPADRDRIDANPASHLEVRLDRVNIRPWANTLVIRIGRGFLRAGDTLTVRLGDTRAGTALERIAAQADSVVTPQTLEEVRG